ncbi:hypothetical protein PSEUDO8AS_60360 [Pseudomonas sp. 8AS]|uniref:hypothetical protein n=1 Tax=Pseudomonas sp. 8AS TaxID=2653163 RepID=UPI0012EF687B|nr:hypothetical protein [Pseudomonas sp. 8AS]VXC30873.1 hypothetical protein PSEUDO8AS_60360 [Pseudomonas sp. 8AS]
MHPAAGALASAFCYSPGISPSCSPAPAASDPPAHGAPAAGLEHPAQRPAPSAGLVAGPGHAGERGTPIGLLWASALSWLLVVLPIAALYLPLLTLGSLI